MEGTEIIVGILGILWFFATLFAAFRASDIVKELKAIRKIEQGNNKILTQLYTVTWEAKEGQRSTLG